MRLYERPERPVDAAIWSLDLKERTARLVVRDRHGCAELTTGAGLMLVHVRAELPVIHASCRGLTGYGADGRLQFRLFRNQRVSRVQVAGPRAYATLGGDPERGVEPRRIAIVDLGRGRIDRQIPMNRRIDLLLRD